MGQRLTRLDDARLDGSGIRIEMGTDRFWVATGEVFSGRGAREIAVSNAAFADLRLALDIAEDALGGTLQPPPPATAAAWADENRRTRVRSKLRGSGIRPMAGHEDDALDFLEEVPEEP